MIQPSLYCTLTSVGVRTCLKTSFHIVGCQCRSIARQSEVPIVQDCSEAIRPQAAASHGVATALSKSCVDRPFEPARSWPSLAWPALSRCKSLGACAADSACHNDCRGSRQLAGNIDAMKLATLLSRPMPRSNPGVGSCGQCLRHINDIGGIQSCAASVPRWSALMIRRARSWRYRWRSLRCLRRPGKRLHTPTAQPALMPMSALWQTELTGASQPL
jgi:hypothetical protein